MLTRPTTCVVQSFTIRDPDSPQFWKLLHRSAFTDELMLPAEHAELPARARCGLTNLVERPTAEANELSSAECRAGVPILVRKLAQHRPRVICFVGKVRPALRYRIQLRMYRASPITSSSS